MINSKILSEIHAILLVLGERFTSKIPNDVLAFIAQEKEATYSPIIDANKSIHEQNLNHHTMALLTTFKLEYWCETESEKEDLLCQLEANEAAFKKDMQDAGSVMGLLEILKKRG